MSVRRFVCRPCRYVAPARFSATFKFPLCPHCLNQMVEANLHNTPGKAQQRERAA